MSSLRETESYIWNTNKNIIMNKNKKCIICGEFNPNPLLKVCSMECGIEQKKNKEKNKVQKIKKQYKHTNKNTPAKFSEKVKREIYKRDWWKCIISWSTEQINFHHAYYWPYAIYSENRNNADQGVCLSAKIHHKIHHWNSWESKKLRIKCMQYLLPVKNKE